MQPPVHFWYHQQQDARLLGVWNTFSLRLHSETCDELDLYNLRWCYGGDRLEDGLPVAWAPCHGKRRRVAVAEGGRGWSGRWRRTWSLRANPRGATTRNWMRDWAARAHRAARPGASRAAQAHAAQAAHARSAAPPRATPARQNLYTEQVGGYRPPHTPGRVWARPICGCLAVAVRFSFSFLFWFFFSVFFSFFCFRFCLYFFRFENFNF
jgi:hypothetical protein